MSDRQDEHELSREFRQERSVRRVVDVIETKRKRIRDDLEQLICHISLLVPCTGANCFSEQTYGAIEDAAHRLGDDAFAQLLLQVLQEGR
ncbi:hypothetical protein IQ249_05925 [Lusitaniella coriacea LEGE 07157]|uniref:Uncharacterized protein n=1 Tax=Lusitaniella coriacea LEGE 07157 TaxID=945747 RepID=A0A8J7B8F5_9CYAN|nr:hypothetical protein [Lusitaniella coriacea]MBE9115435.1 hypothetical protein [Lusitaniella coriacea LEGE 07157]